MIVGYSSLADVLNAGKDPHVEVAAELLDISVERAYERKKNIESDIEFYLARQTSKVVNFGLNARLGWRGLIQQARSKYQLHITEHQAKDAIDAYYARWLEQRDFHDWIDAQCYATGVCHVVHPFSQRHQGLVSATQASNTFSQGLGADLTKEALYQLTKTCYVGDGVLLGSRPVDYIHDEYIVETVPHRLDEKALAFAKVVCEAGNRYLPDVPIPEREMRPYAAARWSKKAHEVRNPDGTLACGSGTRGLDRTGDQDPLRPDRARASQSGGADDGSMRGA